MDYQLFMDEVQCLQNTCDKKPCLLLIENSLSSNMVPEIAAGMEVHDQIEIIFVLKSILHVYNEGVLQS